MNPIVFEKSFAWSHLLFRLGRAIRFEGQLLVVLLLAVELQEGRQRGLAREVHLGRLCHLLERIDHLLLGLRLSASWFRREALRGAEGGLLLDHLEAAELHAELGLLEDLGDVDGLLLGVVFVAIVSVLFVFQFELLPDEQPFLLLL